MENQSYLKEPAKGGGAQNAYPAWSSGKWTTHYEKHVPPDPFSKPEPGRTYLSRSRVAAVIYIEAVECIDSGID